jgi:hypothetical protein
MSTTETTKYDVHMAAARYDVHMAAGTIEARDLQGTMCTWRLQVNSHNRDNQVRDTQRNQHMHTVTGYHKFQYESDGELQLASHGVEFPTMHADGHVM